MAKLYFNYGCMQSAKSLRLIALTHNFLEKGIEFMLLKSSKDTRDGEGLIQSRAGLSTECVPISGDVNLYEYIKKYSTYLNTSTGNRLKWILVDECQFLEPEQVDQLSQVVDLLDINVMCYGLRTDFRSQMFPASKRLFELADDIDELKSYCKCGDRKAIINARIDENGNIVTEGDQVVVGGDDLYVPLCRKCWREKIIAKNSLQ